MKSLQTRATGASCRECRRLKIKCDKQVPCGTCTKRGLQSLCPDGQLSGTKGSRYVLASAEESWHRIQALCVRVQDLEFALDRAHSLVSNDKHPLLEVELVKIGQDPRAVKPESNSPPKAAEDVPSVSNFGTMKISKSGAFRWLGTTALPVLMLDDYDVDNDWKLRAEEGVPKQESGRSTSPPQEIDPLSELKSAAIRSLPDREEALRLIDIYFDFSWRWPLIVCRTIVMDSLFLPAYDGDATTLSTYNLSSLYSILALGALLDLNVEPECQDYKTRQQWANKLFYAQLPKGPSTVDGIEALVLLFRLLCPYSDKTAAKNYELISWGIKLCERIGLHRDPAHLNLSTDECLRRRRVFWAIWFHDSFSSMILGQPPTLTKGFIDCQPPQETTELSDDPHVQFTLFCQDILSHFLESAHHTSYSTVLLIDQKIRQIDHDKGAAYLRSIVTGFGRPVSVVASTLMKGYVRGICNGLLMSLHKTYFSYALLRPGEDPSTGPWASSVNAVYESSMVMMEAAANVSKYMPALHFRGVPNWIHYHGAVMSLYGICIYTPYSPHTEEAMKRADIALADVFQPNAKQFEQAAAILPSLLACQSKARTSLAAYQGGTWVHPAQSPSTPTSITEPFMNTDVFFNHKVAIAGAFSQRGPSHMVSHSHRSSLSDFGEVLKADSQREPRRIVSMDAFHSSPYKDAYYRHSNAGGDAQSIYAGSSSSGSSIIPQEMNAYWSSHTAQSPVQQHPHDERYAFQSTSMDWTTSPVPAHVKVESPPNSTIIWSEQQYGQQLVPTSATVSHPPHLHMLQTPDEYGLTPAPAGPVRRLRGISRARSFPSDNPHAHPGYGSTVNIPPIPSLAPLHTHGHGLHAMNMPSHYLSPQTPSSAHVSQGQGIPASIHGRPMDSVQSPISPHLHQPYSQQHPYNLEQTVPYSPEERQWSESTYQ